MVHDAARAGEREGERREEGGGRKIDVRVLARRKGRMGGEVAGAMIGLMMVG
jgi:hypothetical protein